MLGCSHLPEPRPQTLAEFERDLKPIKRAPIRGEDLRFAGTIVKQSSGYVIRDQHFRTRFRLERRDGNSFAIRNARWQRVGTVGAPNTLGTRLVRDELLRLRGEVLVREGRTIFRDPQGREKLEAGLELE